MLLCINVGKKNHLVKTRPMKHWNYLFHLVYALMFSRAANMNCSVGSLWHWFYTNRWSTGVTFKLFDPGVHRRLHRDRYQESGKGSWLWSQHFTRRRTNMFPRRRWPDGEQTACQLKCHFNFSSDQVENNLKCLSKIHRRSYFHGIAGSFSLNNYFFLLILFSFCHITTWNMDVFHWD